MASAAGAKPKGLGITAAIVGVLALALSMYSSLHPPQLKPELGAAGPQVAVPSSNQNSFDQAKTKDEGTTVTEPSLLPTAAALLGLMALAFVGIAIIQGEDRRFIATAAVLGAGVIAFQVSFVPALFALVLITLFSLATNVLSG